MSQNTSTNTDALGTADKKRAFAEESAILAFTEEVLRRMEEMKVSKSQLAEKLAVDPAAVSKLIGGENNFTLRTMARIALALRSKLKISLAPIKEKTIWKPTTERIGPVVLNTRIWVYPTRPLTHTYRDLNSIPLEATPYESILS